MTAIALQAPLSGSFSWVGENLAAAARLAIADAVDGGWLAEEALELTTFDSAGGVEGAVDAARAIADDDQVLGVVGPAFSRETEASGDLLDAAGLAFVLPVATKAELGKHGWRGFCRLVATDATRAPLTSRLMVDRLGVSDVGVVSDGPASGLAGRVAKALQAEGATIVRIEQVERGAADGEAIASRLLAAGAEGVYFAGEYEDAGRLRRALVEGAAPGSRPLVFVADDGVLTPEFVEVAGASAAEGSFVTFPGADPATAPGDFAARFLAHAGVQPLAFAVEAHLATSLLLRAIAAVGRDRERVAAFVRAFDEELDGHAVAFDEQGENAVQRFYAYEVVDGAWRQRMALTPGD